MSIILGEIVLSDEEIELSEAAVSALFVDGLHNVLYAITDDAGNLVPLDTLAAEGKCMFVSYGRPFYGGKHSETYVSRIIYCPQWKDVCIFAEEAINKTNDAHHVYLEGITLKMTNPVNGISVYELEMGS